MPGRTWSKVSETMLIYVVQFTKTGKPVGNPLHRSPIDAAWHVRRNGADKTDVLYIDTPSDASSHAQVHRVTGREFIARYRDALALRDREQEREATEAIPQPA
jgi:hypothetical protein